MRLAPLVLALLATLAGCGPADVSGPIEAEIVAVGPDGRYGLEVRTVEAVSVTRLEGETTSFLAGVELEVSPDGQSLLLHGGDSMALRLASSGGVYRALDYQGLVALSAYSHMSEAHRFFRELGLGADVADLGPLETLFFPRLRGPLAGLVPLTDNAGYAYPVNAFLLFPEAVLDKLPLAANQGVIVHEFSHAILDHLTTAAAGQALRPEERLPWSQESVNYWRSVDEGIADVFGVAFTGDPDFIAPSGGDLLVGRDASSDHLFTSEMELRAGGSLFSYDPYPLGSVVAATFWDYARGLEAAGAAAGDADRRMAKLAFDAQLALSFSASGFHVTDFLSAAIAVAPDPGARAIFCEAALRRFERAAESIVGCP